MVADPLRELFDAAREGDDAAFTVLVRRTQPVVMRVCTLLGSVDTAEDLTQETYLRAMRAAPAFRGDAPVQAWLLSIARRVCADEIRRLQRRRRLFDRLARLEAPRANPAPGVPLELLVNGLDPDRREAFVLTQYAGLSYEEVAVIVGCPIGTVRSRVFRARTDLLRELGIADAQ